MPSNLEQQILEHLGQFLANQMPLEGFEEWLVANTWNIEQKSDAAAENLAYAIEFLLAEHSSGQGTTEELRRLLSRVSKGVRTIGSETSS